MKKMLIADCGSSKISWLFAEGDRHTQFTTPGLNALLTSQPVICERLTAEVLPHLPVDTSIDAIYFYGAGCVSAQVCADVAQALRDVFGNPAVVEVYSDLLAAARSLCGHVPGIACILGTGSNSCVYDGKDIIDNVSPLGYILGDEGSGAVLGKLLVGNVLKRQLPADICSLFHEQTGLDRLDIINNVYRKPDANRFLASLSPFIADHIDCHELRDMVFEAFVAFFRRNVALYEQASQGMPCHFTGSVAYHYADILAEAAETTGFTIGRIERAPMSGLLSYHISEK